MHRILSFGLVWLAGVAARKSKGPALRGMNAPVARGDDFFKFANGAWSGPTEIPADRSRYGNSAILAELTTQRVHELLKLAAAERARNGSEAQQIGDFYNSFMDEAGIESKGLKVIQPRPGA